jgi:hypothetical protein
VYRFALIAAVAVGLVQALPGRASADLVMYESLDLAVARADLVVRGKVVEIVSLKGENGVVWNRVGVRVAETIKGAKLTSVKFLVREAPFDSGGTAWRNQQDEMLFCLNLQKSPEGPFRVDHVLRRGWICWAIPLTGAPQTRLPIYSTEFTPLSGRKEILLAAARVAEAPPGNAKSQLEWMVQGAATLLPHAVLYPDSERVRAAAKTRRIELLPWK